MNLVLPYSSFTSFLLRLNWETVSSRDLTQAICFSEPITIVILRVTWKKGDERLFFLYQGIVLLEEQDLQYIGCFPGIEMSSKDLNSKFISGKLGFSGNALNALRMPRALNKEMSIGEFLLPSSSRGNQSFAFGHFISEVIPDIIDIQSIEELESKDSMRLLIYPLDQWAVQLLDLFNADYNMLGELPRLKLSDSPEYSSYKLRVRFYRYIDRARSIQRLIQTHANNRFNYHHLNRLIFLTRQSVASSRPVRWIDIESCFQTTLREYPFFQVTAVDPAEGGPLGFHSSYRDRTADLFVSAPGSAVYNALYLTSNPVLIALGSIPLHDSWCGQLEDLRPYGNRIVFISRQVSSSDLNWDESFRLECLPGPRCLKAIFKYMTTFTNLSSSERFVLKYDSFYLSFPLTLNPL